MTVKNRLIRAMAARNGEILRRELAHTGSTAQVTRALNELIQEGRVERTRHGHYLYLGRAPQKSRIRPASPRMAEGQSQPQAGNRNPVDDLYHAKSFQFDAPRFWSTPTQAAPGNKIVTDVLTNPTVQDVAKIIIFFGTDQVKKIWKELRNSVAYSENLIIYTNTLIRGAVQGIH